MWWDWNDFEDGCNWCWAYCINVRRLMQLSSHRYSSHLYELTAGVLTEWNAHVSSSTNDAGNNKQTRNAKLTQTYLQTKTQKRNSTQFIQIMINLKQKKTKNVMPLIECNACHSIYRRGQRTLSVELFIWLALHKWTRWMEITLCAHN